MAAAVVLTERPAETIGMNQGRRPPRGCDPRRAPPPYPRYSIDRRTVLKRSLQYLRYRISEERIENRQMWVRWRVMKRHHLFRDVTQDDMQAMIVDPVNWHRHRRTILSREEDGETWYTVADGAIWYDPETDNTHRREEQQRRVSRERSPGYFQQHDHHRSSWQGGRHSSPVRSRVSHSRRAFGSYGD